MLFFLSVCCRGEVVRCTLWNGYAQQFNDFLAQNNPNENVMAVIQHARIRKWQGNLYLTVLFRVVFPVSIFLQFLRTFFFISLVICNELLDMYIVTCRTIYCSE